MKSSDLMGGGRERAPTPGAQVQSALKPVSMVLLTLNRSRRTILMACCLIVFAESHANPIGEKVKQVFMLLVTDVC